jgi:hypothetical protein
MRLDRNNGRGKYALLKLRDVDRSYKAEIAAAIKVLEEAGVLDYGNTPKTEFFVIRLCDRFSLPALDSYARAASFVDKEYAEDVWELSYRSGHKHPDCKLPD